MFEILRPIEYVVAWIMVAFHKGLTTIGMDPAGGWTWAFSIVGLVVVIRILLIPLFFKQIKSQRGLQMLQPEIKKIQEKHKNDRQKQSEAMMALYKETGTNPLSSCLPILAQAPIFFALFRVLNGVAHDQSFGPLTPELAQQCADATIFGAPISATFLDAWGASPRDVPTLIVSAVLIVLMSATTFLTQKQLMTKNMPAAAMSSPFAQQQKIILYAFPLIFAVTGVNFPIGVLIYWFTTNLWSMGQQFYVIHRMPAPNSPAAQKRHERLERKQAAKEHRAAASLDPGPSPASDGSGASSASIEQSTRPAGQRSQPKRQPRGKRGSAPRNPTGSNPAGTNPGSGASGSDQPS